MGMGWMLWSLGLKLNITMTDYTAELEASFAFVGDHTELQHRFHKSPLKIAKTFIRDQQQLGVCLMDCSPGLMAGDKYRLDWRLLPESSVFITNQSYTKVHPCSERPAYQTQTFHVAKNARLEYKPEPIMLYKGANFRAETELVLEPGAIVFWMDIVCPGRVLRGEVFQFDRYDSRLKVYYQDQLIYYNRQCVEQPKVGTSLEVDESPKMSFRRMGGWEDYTHQGTLYIFTDHMNREYLTPMHHLVQKYPELHCGVSLTYLHGMVISALGKSVWELQQFLEEAWLLMKAIAV
jgi:urease accessory protein